ncbi:MAG: sensor histidine kinase [Candidatus Liptonbacteria bacterium]|nr:sensor histidine kinase [Candidatus Liptonbacteria bacterium]
MKPTGSLRNKIFGAVILVAVVPIILSGILALWILTTSHALDVASIMGNYLNQKAESVSSFVSENLDRLEVIVRLDIWDLITVLEPSDQVNPGDAVAQTRTQERIRFLVRPEDLSGILADLLAASPAISEAYFIDRDSGREVASLARHPTYPDREGVFEDLRRLPPYQVALKGKRYVGPVVQTLNGPEVTLAAPVLNRTGRVIGVLAAQLQLDGLAKIFDRGSLGNSGYLLLSSDSDHLMYRGAAQSGTIQDLGRYGIVQAARESNTGTVLNQTYPSPWGGQVIAAGRVIRDNGLNWVIAAEWPATDANRVLDTIRNQFLFFSFAVLVLTVLLSVILANRIVRPIRELQGGARRVAEGSFEQQINIATNDEIAELGQEFNSMMQGLKRLKELREEFVFIAAHELKTPVAAIKGYISFVLDEKMSGPISAQAKEFLSQVNKANKRLVQLVEDLLEVARSEAGRLKIQVNPVVLGEPIRAVLTELQPLADEKKIQLAYAESGPGPQALADADRIKEVMVNLVGNAIKYTLPAPAGQKANTVTVGHELRPGEIVTHVTDTGLGMSPEAQQRLFEKFYRIQTDQTQHISGTGLGLFIVRQIIEKMGGKIWARSEEGKGSTFSFSLPAVS